VKKKKTTKDPIRNLFTANERRDGREIPGALCSLCADARTIAESACRNSLSEIPWDL
jgi:hypothetical protein